MFTLINEKRLIKLIKINVKFLLKLVCQKYGNNVNLLATDTDSLIYQIFTRNIYEDCQQNEYVMKSIFDLSNYGRTNGS